MAFYSDPRLAFTWDLVKVSEDGSFEIRLDFEQIIEVSKSKAFPDYVEITFWNPFLFQTQDGYFVEK